MSADKVQESVRVLVALDEYDYAREEWRSRPSIQSWEKVESARETLIATVREDEKARCVAAVERLTWARPQDVYDIVEAIRNA